MKISYKKLNEIIPYENNPRKINKGVDIVAESIQQYGFQQPIVVDTDGVIIVGHTRYQASKKLGLAEVPVTVADELTEEQIRTYRIMDNKSGEKTFWDEGLLVEELKELLPDSSIQDLSFETGFSESELNNWLSEPEKDDLSDLTHTKVPRAVWGDVYTLGEHKLVCGDSSDAETVKLLMGEDTAEIIWEDPPYGVAYASPNAVKLGNEFAKEWREEHSIENDDLNEEQLNELLTKHMSAILPYWNKGGAVYWCHDQRFNHQFKQILIAHNVHISDTLIWKKNQASTFVGDYCKIYEPILYGWQKGEAHRWYAERNQNNAHTDEELDNLTKEQLIKLIRSYDTNYQEIKRLPSRETSKMHPTVKPPKLISYHLLNSTKRGDIVYDGFSGSGSTLIACEKTNRVARCIEFETKYIDVIINRWQELTGLKATRQDGTLWDDIYDTALQDEVDDNLREVFNLASE
jgi:DNA modification methylase